MSAQLVDGNALGAKLRAALEQRTTSLKEKGITPCLAVILVGSNPASQVYVRNKVLACEKVGILEAIDVSKDVDGFHAENVGRLSQGQEAFIPCTPHGVMKMFEEGGVSLKGAEAVVIGRSNIVGKPMAMLLIQAGATVTVCHSQTRDLKFHTQRADIVIAAVGKPKLVTGDMIKPGAVVIDVGINRLPDGKLCGDVDFDSAKEVAGVITPVPGGVGPMTITMLLENTVISAERRAR